MKFAGFFAFFICQLANAQTNFFPVLVCSNATYTNATIETVTPATVTVWWSGGGERISITNLPVTLQKLYNYNPDAAREYLAAQAAKRAKIQQQANDNQAALAAARGYVGEAQTIRVLGMINDMSCQIEEKGQVSEAFIPNLPYAVVAFLQDLDLAGANAARLRNQAKARTTIIARPTGRKGADGSREWRFVKMAMPEPITEPSEQSDGSWDGPVVDYRNWPVIETAHFRFRFSPLLHLDNGAANGYIVRHEAAFEKINQFFHAQLLKKIDFFVWSSSREAETAGVGVLGFANPKMTLTHQSYEQTDGHEMTHVLCYWAFLPVKTTRLINEGVAVYFDQTKRNRLEEARRAIRRANLERVSVVELWTEPQSQSEGVFYPVAAAFIERLRINGGDQRLKALLQEQTLADAQQIYGPQLTDWMTQFEQDLFLRE